MPTPYEPTRPPEPSPHRLTRPVEGRWIGGVCAGLAEHLDLDVNVVRICFVLASFLGGAGIGVYLFLWALTPQERPATDPVVGQGDPTRRSRPMRSEAARNLLLGAALVVLGTALVLQQRGVNLRLDIVIPVLVVALGAVLAWTQLDDTERDRWLARGGADRPPGMLRLGAGVVLAIAGIIGLAALGRGLGGLWNVAVAAAAVLAGVALIATPWAVRLWNDLREEQARLVRATERADIAAHLHDSVLQTLALIQRKADDPAEVARLARAQERELRGWLYAGPRGSGASLATAVTEVAHEVEDLHGVPVELVVTGDRPLEEPGQALVRALREALLNAVRHGRPPVSAYVEVGPTLVEAFVRDHGDGFEADAVPADRLGVRESIVGRMDRHGGSARVRRLEDGTEVALSLPVAPPGDETERSPETVAPQTNPTTATEPGQRAATPSEPPGARS
ncbi:ATP-binding protein [Oryzihumus leptocrescens]|uniref:Phage shock protein C (PspC) family protein n=1 Tax=Oryzihumus leptocrescens TaxID=297536 RepID=A0A542ZFQ8_9MICO|nr:ATP-binding protein [Oryzihumus leptocrescens]TQL59176.1 phage shock protein C (PspC) family protein [Oryzihumus leptocrescens]